MPTTSLGLTYPASTAHTRLWEHFQTLAQDVDDEIVAIFAAWTNFAGLAWTASAVNPVIGNGSMAARYKQIGKTIHYEGKITMGSTTTYGTGDWRVNLPVTAAGGSATAVGSGVLIDISTQANWRPAACYPVTTTLIRFVSTAGLVDSTSLTWATGDELHWGITYEAA